MNVQAPSRFNNAHKVDLKKAAELWADNISASQIASMFGVTRSSIIGLTFRNRDLFPLKAKVPSQRAMRRIAAEARGPRLPKPPKPKSPEKVAKIAAEEYDTARLDLAKPLHLLSSCECHWPLNDGDPFVFCAEETKEGQSFCTQHRMRAYRPRKAKEQA